MERGGHLPQATSQAHGKTQARLPHPSVWRGAVLAGFLTVRKRVLPREQTSWLRKLQPACRGQGLSRRRALGRASCQPVRPTVPSICLTSLTPSCRLQPGQQPDPSARRGRNRSCPRAAQTTVISAFSHTVQDDTSESASGVGVGGVKQTGRRGVWEASRQTACRVAMHTLRWRLV